ncbi:MAG: dicarboxylate/amino acid:cation symporter [Clostridiaceae bacterium]
MNTLKNYKSSLYLLLAMIVGSVIGAIWKEKIMFLQPVADTFLNLLFCLVVPIVFLSLVSAIAGMKNLKKLSQILSSMMGIFILTGVVAAIYMLVVVVVFDPSKGAQVAMTEVPTDLAANNNFLSMFTVSDFPLLFSRKSLMALIVFAISIGIAIVSIGEKAKAALDFFNSMLEITMKLVTYVMKLAPIGLAAFFATLIGQYGTEIAGPLSRSIIIYLVAAVVYYFASNSIFAFIGGGAEGVSLFWKNIIPPTLTALGTCSSAASIPTNLIAAENIGITDEVKSISIPMGANLHKDGAVLIQILKIGFMCSMYGMNILEPKTMITAIVVSVVASTVMGAIPAGGYVGEIFIISAFNFPPESIPIMVLIGTITDAPATAINVTGDVGVAMILNRIIDGKNWMKNKLAKAENVA